MLVTVEDFIKTLKEERPNTHKLALMHGINHFFVGSALQGGTRRVKSWINGTSSMIGSERGSELYQLWENNFASNGVAGLDSGVQPIFSNQAV